MRMQDGPAVHALVQPAIEGSPYSSGARSAFERVLGTMDFESRACVAEHEGRLVGIAIYGGIAGSLGVARLPLVVIDPTLRMRGIAARLVDSVLEALAAEGMRLVIVELPDDPALDAALRLLLRCRFRVEATVTDYFRDGINLAILRRELTRG